MKILVVDDEAQYRFLVRTVLQDEGHEVLDAADGEEALVKMARVKVDLVVLDVYMPVMDGIKLHRTIREIPGYERLPFLFVSGYDDPHTRGAVKDPRYEGFLKKGKPAGLLLEWIRFLSTPADQRPKLPPTESSSLSTGRSERGKRER